MKHIKKFEDNNICRYYYLLPTDDRFKDAVKQIRCNNIIKQEISNIEGYHGQQKYIFIGIDIINTKSDWSWNQFEGSLNNQDYDRKNYIFKGAIMLTDNEIEQIELNQNINKYNL